MLHLMTGHGTVVGSQLVIDIKIPLFNRQSSQFYRVIPIPFKEGGTVMIARVKAPYIVYNFELDSFHFLTQAMLNECKETLGKEIMCEGNFPWRDASTNQCELAPFRPHININCAYDETERMPYWMPLQMQGNWLFKTFSNNTAHLKCSHKQQAIMELPQQGNFSLEADCTGRVGQVTLVDAHRVRNEVTAQFHSFLLKDVSEADKKTIKPIGDLLINHDKQINQLKECVDKLRNENVELRGLNFHHMSGHTSLILVSMVIVILIILLIRKIMIIRRIAAIQFPRPVNV